MQRGVYALTKALDPSQLVNDASGWCDEVTDIFTVHTSEQEPGKLAQLLVRDAQGRMWRGAPAAQAPHAGRLHIVDEFGGIKWVPPERRPYRARSWGSSDAPKTLEALYARWGGLVNALLSPLHVCGYCYPQLRDAGREQNGSCNYARSAKGDMRRIARIFRRAPAVPQRVRQD